MNGEILVGDARDIIDFLPAASVHTCVTSPPYFGLRDYGHAAQIGLETTPDAYVAELVAVFAEVRRVLRDDGTVWLNLGDSYAGGGRGGGAAASKQQTNVGSLLTPKPLYGLKPKDLIGIPWRVAFALQADGWYLRQDIIWKKPNPMPESVTDRCTKSHEYLFLLSKRPKYYFDAAAIAERSIHAGRVVRATGAGAKNGQKGSFGATALGFTSHDTPVAETRNRRSVWTVVTKPFKGAHFATFPPALIEPCILAGCPAGGTVLDPFFGAGTTGLVAQKNGRRFIGIDINPEYADMAQKRITEARPASPSAPAFRQ